MTIREQKGCGRKIKAAGHISCLIKGVLESLVKKKSANAAAPGEEVYYCLEVPPALDEEVIYLDIPQAMQQNAEYLLSTGKLDLEYPCCTIVHGDCRSSLINFPPRSFDLIVTDPPYGKKFKPCQEHHGKPNWDCRFPTEIMHGISDESSILGGLARLGSYIFCEWDNLWDHQRRVDVVAPGGSLAITLDKPKSVLVWHKIGGGGMGDTAKEHVRDYEMALFYPGPEHKFKYRPPSVLKYKALGNNAHPTQKPPGLIKEILGWYDFETVFDPYMGSGTTAIAAKALGKHFFGFEANETYYRRAVQRLAEMDEQPASRTKSLLTTAR